MLIFGYRVKVAVLATLSYICDRCSVPAAHRVVKRTRFFTLFFIPLFPIGTTYSDTCINCGRVIPLTKEQVDRVPGIGAPATPNAA